jgi:hypothetical protein
MYSDLRTLCGATLMAIICYPGQWMTQWIVNRVLNVIIWSKMMSQTGWGIPGTSLPPPEKSQNRFVQIESLATSEKKGNADQSTGEKGN